MNNQQNRFIVASTMSSGKSTLINALIGKEVLPSENQACTGKIFEIENNFNKNTIKIVKNEEIIEKELNIENLKELNTDNEVETVKISTEFHNFDKKIVFYDTPGVNNYLNSTHGKITYEFIKNTDIENIIYILNATQLGTTDDKRFLIDLKEICKKNQKNILFVLNKIDLLDEEFESKDDIINNAQNYLRGLGFDNADIVPISAYSAKLLRKAIKNGLDTRKERLEYQLLLENSLEKDISLLEKELGIIFLEDKIKSIKNNEKLKKDIKPKNEKENFIDTKNKEFKSKNEKKRLSVKNNKESKKEVKSKNTKKKSTNKKSKKNKKRIKLLK